MVIWIVRRGVKHTYREVLYYCVVYCVTVVLQTSRHHLKHPDIMMTAAHIYSPE